MKDDCSPMYLNTTHHTVNISRNSCNH